MWGYKEWIREFHKRFPTSRGGHFIFKASEKTRKRIKCLLNLGFRVDLLTDKVNIVSPHKSLANSNLDPTNLDPLPDFVLPHYKSRKTPIITESLIPEG